MYDNPFSKRCSRCFRGELCLVTSFGKGVSSLMTVSFTIRMPLDIKTLTIPFQREDTPDVFVTGLELLLW